MIEEYPVIDMKATGQWLRFLCKRDGISVVEIQRYLNFSSNQAIYAWFNGKSLPSLDNFCALASFLGVSMDSMLVFCNREHPFLRRCRSEQKRMIMYWWKINRHYEKYANL